MQKCRIIAKICFLKVITSRRFSSTAIEFNFIFVYILRICDNLIHSPDTEVTRDTTNQHKKTNTPLRSAAIKIEIKWLGNRYARLDMEFNCSVILAEWNSRDACAIHIRKLCPDSEGESNIIIFLFQFIWWPMLPSAHFLLPFCVFLCVSFSSLPFLLYLSILISISLPTIHTYWRICKTNKKRDKRDEKAH